MPELQCRDCRRLVSTKTGAATKPRPCPYCDGRLGQPAARERRPVPAKTWYIVGGVAASALLILAIVLATSGGSTGSTAPVSVPRPADGIVQGPQGQPQTPVASRATPADWAKHKDSPISLKAEPTMICRGGGGRYLVMGAANSKVVQILDLEHPGESREVELEEAPELLAAGKKSFVAYLPQANRVWRYGLGDGKREGDVRPPLGLNGLAIGFDSDTSGVARVHDEVHPFDPSSLKFGAGVKAAGANAFARTAILPDAQGTLFGIGAGTNGSGGFVVRKTGDRVEARPFGTRQAYVAPTDGAAPLLLSPGEIPRGLDRGIAPGFSPSETATYGDYYLPGAGAGYVRIRAKFATTGPRKGPRLATGYDAAVFDHAGRELGEVALPSPFKIDATRAALLPNLVTYMPGPKLFVVVAGDKVHGVPLAADSSGTAVANAPQEAAPDGSVPLPFIPDSARLGGAGRYLILGAAQNRDLLVVEPGSGKGARTIRLPEASSVYAADRASLVVYLPRKAVLQRYGLVSGEFEAEEAARGVIGLALGHDSDGSGLVLSVGSASVFDARTLRAGPEFARIGGDAESLRGPVFADAQGKRFGISGGPFGKGSRVRVEGGRVNAEPTSSASPYQTPSDDGKWWLMADQAPGNGQGLFFQMQMPSMMSGGPPSQFLLPVAGAAFVRLGLPAPLPNGSPRAQLEPEIVVYDSDKAIGRAVLRPDTLPPSCPKPNMPNMVVYLPKLKAVGMVSGPRLHVLKLSEAVEEPATKSGPAPKSPNTAGGKGLATLKYFSQFQAMSAGMGMTVLSPNEPTLKFVKKSGPDWVKVKPNGEIDLRPPADAPGRHTYVVTATDPSGDSIDLTFQIDVSKPRKK